MKTLSELVSPYESVSFIGMCKNAGKTTTFNRLIRELREQNIRLPRHPWGETAKARIL